MSNLREFEFSVIANNLSHARQILRDLGFHVTKGFPAERDNEFIFTVVV